MSKQTIQALVLAPIVTATLMYLGWYVFVVNHTNSKQISIQTTRWADQKPSAEAHRGVLKRVTQKFWEASLNQNTSEALDYMDKIKEQKEALVKHHHYSKTEVEDLFVNASVEYYRSLDREEQLQMSILMELLKTN